MGYNRYIYSDATLKAKAANNKAGLLKNKKRSDSRIRNRARTQSN